LRESKGTRGTGAAASGGHPDEFISSTVLPGADCLRVRDAANGNLEACYDEVGASSRASLHAALHQAHVFVQIFFITVCAQSMFVEMTSSNPLMHGPLMHIANTSPGWIGGLLILFKEFFNVHEVLLCAKQIEKVVLAISSSLPFPT
jgi:Na+-transporting NADH:ubiquinone oxidoreductase subunit NqrA